MFLVIIDRGDEKDLFVPFVGMPIAPCFKGKLLQRPPTPPGPKSAQGCKPKNGAGAGGLSKEAGRRKSRLFQDLAECDLR